MKQFSWYDIFFCFYTFVFFKIDCISSIPPPQVQSLVHESNASKVDQSLAVQQPESKVFLEELVDLRSKVDFMKNEKHNLQRKHNRLINKISNDKNFMYSNE